ncbi:MAG: PAS domain S-box protein, partial [Peptococcales bacterium]
MIKKDTIYHDSNLFKEFFQHSIYPVAILDRDYNFVFVNEAYAKADGKDISFFQEKNHFDLYPSDSKRLFDKVLQTKVPYQTHANPFIYTKNPERGKTYWDLSLVPILDKNTGEVNYLILSLYDVTESIRASQIFSATFESSSLAMALINADGYIIKANNSLLSLLGYKKDEIINKQFQNLNLFDENADFSKIMDILGSKNNINHLELMIKQKNGNIRAVVLSVSIVQIKNENYYYCILNDITKIKAMELEIQRLDRLNIIGEMAASIAHEVRNPITAIKGFLQLFMKKNQLEDHKELFSVMIGELDRVNALITEFLLLAKNQPDSKKMSNLNKILKTLYPLLYAEAIKDSKDICLKLSNIPDLFIDENEIRQLILNLCRNGLEAMSDNGVLTIETIDAPKMVIIKIIDQGKGISQDIINDIFTPFYTTKEHGTGLGLSICLRIAQRH